MPRTHEGTHMRKRAGPHPRPWGRRTGQRQQGGSGGQGTDGRPQARGRPRDGLAGTGQTSVMKTTTSAWCSGCRRRDSRENDSEKARRGREARSPFSSVSPCVPRGPVAIAGTLRFGGCTPLPKGVFSGGDVQPGNVSTSDSL